MILHDSSWLPDGEKPAVAARRIVRTGGDSARDLPVAGSSKGSWPSFRGPNASGVADGQHIPDRWDGTTGENILWHTPIPGLAHSSPIVWGDRVFVTSAISSKPDATFKPGLYGDGDASDDRSRHKWMLYAIDKRTGKIVWERVAFEGEPGNKRHIKSTYASASPATDGRIVVAWFGSQGVYAYDMNGAPAVEGGSRPRRHGRVRHSRRTSGDRRARRSSGTVWCIAAVRHAGRFVRARARRRDRRDGVEDGPRRSCRRGARRPS